MLNFFDEFSILFLFFATLLAIRSELEKYVQNAALAPSLRPTKPRCREPAKVKAIRHQAALVHLSILRLVSLFVRARSSLAAAAVAAIADFLRSKLPSGVRARARCPKFLTLQMRRQRARHRLGRRRRSLLTTTNFQRRRSFLDASRKKFLSRATATCDERALGVEMRRVRKSRARPTTRAD